MSKAIITSVGKTGIATRKTLSVFRAEQMFFIVTKWPHITYAQLTFENGEVHIWRKGNPGVSVFRQKDFE